MTSAGHPEPGADRKKDVQRSVVSFVTDQQGRKHMDIGGGLIGLLILIADIWAIIQVLGSGASTGSKLLWILLIVILPVVGLIIWFFAGPRGGRVAA